MLKFKKIIIIQYLYMKIFMSLPVGAGVGSPEGRYVGIVVGDIEGQQLGGDEVGTLDG